MEEEVKPKTVRLSWKYQKATEVTSTGGNHKPSYSCYCQLITAFHTKNNGRLFYCRVPQDLLNNI